MGPYDDLSICRFLVDVGTVNVKREDGAHSDKLGREDTGTGHKDNEQYCYCAALSGYGLRHCTYREHELREISIRLRRQASRERRMQRVKDYSPYGRTSPLDTFCFVILYSELMYEWYQMGSRKLTLGYVGKAGVCPKARAPSPIIVPNANGIAK